MKHIAVFASAAILAASLAAQAAPAKGGAKPAPQSVRILVTEEGFQPSSVTLKKGVPARITFLRKSDRTCATSVIMPDYAVSKALPLNRETTVAFTPKKSGRVAFSCGMNMVRGSIVVR